MAKIRDLLDETTRARLEEEAEEVAASLLPERGFDTVGCWPGDRLGELIEQRPDLLPELIRRRPSEVTQL